MVKIAHLSPSMLSYLGSEDLQVIAICGLVVVVIADHDGLHYFVWLRPPLTRTITSRRNRCGAGLKPNDSVQSAVERFEGTHHYRRHLREKKQ